MTSAPSMGCSSDNCLRRESAGGQLEQPSEVKSSTRTGRPEEGFEDLGSRREVAEPPTRAKASTEAKARKPEAIKNERLYITCPAEDESRGGRIRLRSERRGICLIEVARCSG